MLECQSHAMQASSDRPNVPHMSTCRELDKPLDTFSVFVCVCVHAGTLSYVCVCVWRLLACVHNLHVHTILLLLIGHDN